MELAKFWQNKNGLISCGLCQHSCVIKENDCGICGCRINKAGKLYSLVYGYPIAMNIDPIEKKPLFHFMPSTMSYSVGTYGCNFSCQNCQNWDISQVRNIEAKVVNLDYVEPEKIIEEALGNDCSSISYTYNEPTVFCEYALDTMKLAHEHKLKNVWVSNGYMSDECLEAILPYIDAMNIDLKSFDRNFYKDYCMANLEPVLKNLKKIYQEQIHLEITSLIIPSLSDDISMLGELTDFIASELDADVPWHISKFSPSISWKLKNLPPTPDDMIYEAYEIGKEAGLSYVYIGNMPGDSKENTYCPKCGELAIHRFGYQIERHDNGGFCSNCERNLGIVD